MSTALLVTAAHVKMRLGDNALNNERLSLVMTKLPIKKVANHCQKLGTRWRLRVRTKAIMAANSYKKMYGDKETCSNISIMSLRDFGARLETY